MRTCTAICCALLLTACGLGEAELGGESEELSDETSVAEAPLLGVAQGDAADRLCHVVLREVSQPAATTGWESSCTNGKCWFVWAGTFDVSKEAVATGVRGYVLYESTNTPGTWFKTTAARVSGAPTGYQRYKFKLTQNTVGAGVTASALDRTRIQLIPYITTTADSSRHFDHNRILSGTGSYVLNKYNGYAIGNDANVCQPAKSRGTVSFAADNVTSLGTLKASGALTVHYDLNRMPTCRSTHNGFPAWDLKAFAKFLPSNEIREQSVRAFETNFGTPTNVSYAVPFTTPIPVGTTGVELWFNNSSGAGSTCSDWDSVGGFNYRFTVAP
jgi:hypothetical protein